MIRAMDEGDVDAVADLAHSARLLRSSWEPPMWAASTNARDLHPLLLRRQLSQGAPAFVDESRGGIDGALLAGELPCADAVPGGAWAVEDFFVASPGAWTSVGRALLIALAARADDGGVGEIVVSCLATDTAKAAMLADAGLRRTAWVRLRAVTTRASAPPPGVRAVVAADDDALGPLVAAAPAPRHTLVVPRRCEPDGSLSHDGLALDDGGGPVGVALVSPAVAAPPGHERRDATVVAEPVVLAAHADWSADGARLVRGVEWLAAGRGDQRVAIPCGPGERAKDEELAAMGYTAPLEWWTLELRAVRAALSR